MTTSLRAFLRKSASSTWTIFILLSVVLFIKIMYFHWFTFHSVLLSSIYHNPSEFFRFWGGKVAPILFLSSFVFLTKRHWWTVFLNIIVDIWIISNIFYFKANGFFLSYESIKLIDNMSGFWDSLYSYMSLDMLLYPFLTIVFSIIIYHSKSAQKTRPLLFCIFMTCSLVVSFIDTILYREFQKTWNGSGVGKEIGETMLAGEQYHYFFPFAHVYFFARVETCTDYNAWSKLYVKEQSVVSFFPAMLIYNILSPSGDIIDLTTEQEEKIAQRIYTTSKVCTPSNNVVFILFESLESWALHDVVGYNYMPYLSNIINRDNVFYCDKIKPQVAHANSADGQLIDVTGLLPITDGATCRLYGANKYPSYAECFNYSAIVNPAKGMWNQEIVTYNYQFKELIEPINGSEWGGDKGLLDNMFNYIDSVGEPFCVLGITVSSHVPFTRGETHPKHIIDGMPPIMSAYLNCLSYTDSLIGVFIDKVKETDKYSNTTFVISGDHTILRSENKDIDNFAKDNRIDMQTTKTYTPLIILSPLIKGNITINEPCYQMDIYPTILSLIKCDNYYWRGLGVNLLKIEALTNRQIIEQDAMKLSDLIIRSNYFERYYNHVSADSLQ